MVKSSSMNALDTRGSKITAPMVVYGAVTITPGVAKFAFHVSFSHPVFTKILE